MSHTVEETGKCALCGKTYYHYGNNPEPVMPYWNRVCDYCNTFKVIPARLEALYRNNKVGK